MVPMLFRISTPYTMPKMPMTWKGEQIGLDKMK